MTNPVGLAGMLNDHGNDQWMEPDRFEPMVNIDGTMMLGDFDVNGNMYGVTDSHFDSWDSNDASSMFD